MATAMETDPVALMDLDVEVLSEVLSHLEARWRLAAQQTCRTLALLTSELALETTYLVSTVAESAEVAHAELVPKLSSPPSVGVIFANSGLAQCKGGITKLLRSLPPAMHAIGGEVDTLVGTRAVGEEAEAEAEAAPPADAANAPNAEAAEPAGAQEGNMPHFATPHDMYDEEATPDHPGFLPSHEGIAYLAHQQYLAMRQASKQAAPRAAGLMVRKETGLALTLGAFPEAEVSSFVVRPSQLPSPSNPASPADRPSTEEQLETQGALSGEWKVFVVMMVGGGRGIGNVISRLQGAHPDAAIIGGVATGRWLVRAHAHRLEYVRNGVVGLMFRGNVPLTALVCSGAPLAQLRDAKRELHEGNKALLGGLLFTCTARNEEQDANAFATTFPQAPLVGLPCGGEIGPAARRGPATGLATQKGSARLQGFTAVYGLFAVPVRRRA